MCQKNSIFATAKLIKYIIMNFSIKTILIALLSMLCFTVLAQKETVIKGKINNNTFKNVDLVIAYDTKAVSAGTAQVAEDGTFTLKTKLSSPDIYKLNFDNNAGAFLIHLNPNETINIETSSDKLQNIIAVSGSEDMTFVKKMSDMYEEMKRVGDSINTVYKSDKSINYYNEFYTRFQMYYQTNQKVDTYIMNTFTDYSLLLTEVQANSKNGKLATKDIEGYITTTVATLKRMDENYTPFANYLENVTGYYDYETPSALADPQFSTILTAYVQANNAKNEFASKAFSSMMPTVQVLINERDSLMFNNIMDKKTMKAYATKLTEEVLKFTNLNEFQKQFTSEVPQVQKMGAGIPDLAKQMIQQRGQQYQRSYTQIVGALNEELQNTLKENKESLASLMFLDLFPKDQYTELHATVITALAAKYPNHLLVKERNDVLKSAPIQVGSMAPDIAYANPDGKIMKLSDLRGKVVLLDFWASWCRPCRMENPNVVKLYNKYKDKGFDVYSYSLDRDKASWVAAIEKDGLVWPNHTSDLKGWQAEGAKPYKVRQIPTTFLIDREGKILVINPRGAALEKALKDIFGE